MDQARWIIESLPPVEEIELRSEVDYYGAANVIAADCGLERAPVPKASWQQYWQHGWFYFDPVHPVQFCEGGTEDLLLVATQESVDFLASREYSNVHAVGMPFVYADFISSDRKPGSLLVMPPHSIASSQHNWNQDEYANEIAKLKRTFSCVIACISKSCVDKGYWTEAFEQHGIPWITGARPSDRNALRRMNKLFKSFEFMTTNATGSHIPYAAYSGCKVSIYGPFSEFEPQDFKDNPYYQKHPEILEADMAATKEAAIRQRYPMLFGHPSDATQRIEWGAEMLGAKFRRSATEIANLLGWSPKWEIVKERLGRLLPEKIKSPLRRLNYRSLSGIQWLKN